MKKLLIASALVLAVASAHAGVIIWTAAGTADYADGTSWEDSANMGTPYGSAPLVSDSHGLIGPWSGGVWPTVDSNIGVVTPNVLGIGWDGSSHGEFNVVDGGFLVVNNPVLGFNTGSTGVLNMSGGVMVAAIMLDLGMGGGSGTVNLSGDAVLHAGNATAAAGSTVNLTDDSHFIINGDWTAAGLVDTVIFATDAGTSINQFYTDVEGEGPRTHWTVIPEPATFGLFALMGGALLFARRNFRN